MVRVHAGPPIGSESVCEGECITHPISNPHPTGGLAQLARAPALHAGGHRFDSDILHTQVPGTKYLVLSIKYRAKKKIKDLLYDLMKEWKLVYEVI